MKKITDLDYSNNQFNIADIQETNKKIADQLISKDIIKKRLEELNDNSLIYKDPIVFRFYYDSYSKCIDCKSLNDCKQVTKKGYYEYLNDELNIELRSCKYEKEQQIINNYKKNIIINDMDADLVEQDYNDKISKENPSYQKALIEAIKWIENPNKVGLYLSGYFGVGKSFLAAQITIRLALQGHKVAFIKMQNLITSIKEDYDYTLLERIKKLYFIVFDDIGAENITDWSRDEILYPILKYRKDNNLYTWFTSNDDIDVLEFRYTEIKNNDLIKGQRLIESIKVLSREININGSNRRLLERGEK